MHAFCKYNDRQMRSNRTQLFIHTTLTLYGQVGSTDWDGSLRWPWMTDVGVDGAFAAVAPLSTEPSALGAHPASRICAASESVASQRRRLSERPKDVPTTSAFSGWRYPSRSGLTFCRISLQRRHRVPVIIAVSTCPPFRTSPGCRSMPWRLPGGIRSWLQDGV